MPVGSVYYNIIVSFATKLSAMKFDKKLQIIAQFSFLSHFLSFAKRERL